MQRLLININYQLMRKPFIGEREGKREKKYFPGNLIAQQLRIPLPKRQKRSFTYIRLNMESSYYYIGNNILQKQVVSTKYHFSHHSFFLSSI